MEPVRGSNNNQPDPISQQEVNIPTLPREVVMLIFSQLDELSISKASSVDKIFNVEVLNSIKNQEFKLLNSFLGGLIAHLNTMKVEKPSSEIDEVIKKLEDLVISANERKPINLLEVKSSLMSVKDEVVTILKKLPRDKLETLIPMTDDKTPLSWDMEIYPDLIQEGGKGGKPYNTVFVLASIPLNFGNQYKMHVALHFLELYGLVDRGIKLAEMISDEPTKKETFNYLAVMLCEAGYTKKGIEVAKSQGIDVGNIFKELGKLSSKMKNLIYNNKFDEIVKIADKLDVKNKDALLGFVALEFFHIAKPENAIKAYNLISDSSPSNMDTFFKQKWNF